MLIGMSLRIFCTPVIMALDVLLTRIYSRTLLAERLVSLPWEGLKLSQGEPAIPTRFL